MAVELGRSMRSEHYPMLLGEMSDAQGLGEAGGAGRVELHITDAARDNKIAHRETGQLPFAVSERDRRRRRQPGESAGCKYQCSGSSSQKIRCGSTAWAKSMQSGKS